MDPSSLGVASAGSGVELGLADPASLAWEDNLVATALNLSTPQIRCVLNYKSLPRQAFKSQNERLTH